MRRGRTIKKPQRTQRDAEVVIAGVGWWDCRAAFSDAFFKETESIWCMDVKQSEAWGFLCIFFFRHRFTPIYADFKLFGGISRLAACSKIRMRHRCNGRD